MYRLEPLTNVYDTLHSFWARQSTQKSLATALVLAFIFSFVAIQLKIWGVLNFLPSPVLAIIPTNHFHSVSLAFTMLLFLEVMSLIFVLSCSMSKAIGKQMEILALILLRNAFKELTYLHEPISFALDHAVVPRIMVSSLGALFIFACIGLYRRMPRYHNTMPAEDVMGYVMSKKILALLLLTAVAIVGVNSLYDTMVRGNLNTTFFENVYTILIFTDILMVLVAQRYLPNFQGMFRNSGYVIATLLMRISFAAPPFVDTLIGVVATLYAMVLTWTVHKFYSPKKTGAQTEEIG